MSLDAGKGLGVRRLTGMPLTISVAAPFTEAGAALAKIATI